LSARLGSRTAQLADADDLRVEHIAAQLEEAEQQRLTDYWIEGATLGLTHDRPHYLAAATSEAPKINHGSAAKCVEEP
jgi:hypothetical protein